VHENVDGFPLEFVMEGDWRFGILGKGLRERGNAEF
jgi:hypothetical protein